MAGTQCDMLRAFADKHPIIEPSFGEMQKQIGAFLPPIAPSDSVPLFSNPGLLRSRDDLQDNFYRLSRTITLRKVYEPLQQCSIEDIVRIIDENTPANQLIDYRTFRKILSEIYQRSSIYREILTVKTFLALPRSKEIASLPTKTLKYHVDLVKLAIVRIVSSAQTRITLTTCDVDGKGYLLEPDIENYIMDISALYPHLRDCDEVFRPFYLCTIIKPLFFFLDPYHRKQIAISDLLISPYLDQIFANPADQPQEALGTLQGPLAQRYLTWFHPDAVLDLYTTYISADTDQDGLLSATEIAALTKHKFTIRFIKALILTTQTFNEKMDYRGFIDLMLCVSFPRSKAAAVYIFKILDFDCKGYLSRDDVLYFLSEMVDGLQAYCGEGVKFNTDDLCDEVFDSVSPKKSGILTLSDIISSRSGDILITFLVDPLLFIEKELQLQQGHVMMKPLPFEV